MAPQSPWNGFRISTLEKTNRDVDMSFEGRAAMCCKEKDDK